MEEGYSTSKPPSFKGVKYDYWQERMSAHFEFIHIDLWYVVANVWMSKNKDLCSIPKLTMFFYVHSLKKNTQHSIALDGQSRCRTH